MLNSFYDGFDEETSGEQRTTKDHRSPFQVDRDRILFSFPFRRLQSKTQVFQSGEFDFYRTRLTHTIEVARIARSIAEYLNCRDPNMRADYRIDPDLVEGVGLAHDLGHPPFGHIGERKLNNLMRPHGGFEGNAQTLRILTSLIYPREQAPRGMQPTRAFLDGVLKYKALHRECHQPAEEGRLLPPENHFLYDDQEKVRDFVFRGMSFANELSAEQWNSLKSVECQIMDWADDTAYSLHDISDGIQAGFITLERLERWGAEKAPSGLQAHALEELCRNLRDGYFEPRVSRKIGKFIGACSLVESSHAAAGFTERYRWNLRVDPAVVEECRLNKNLAVDLIFKSPAIQQIEYKSGLLLGRLFEAFYTNYVEGAERSLRILPPPVAGWIERARTPSAKVRLICDHLAGMTDGQALRAYRRLFEPDFASIIDIV